MDATTTKALSSFKDYALSSDDIRELIPHTNIFTYPHLDSVSHIDEVLDGKGRAIMLWLTEDENTGHWVAIIRRGKTIEVYDAYGKKPDSTSFINNLGNTPEDLERFNQDQPLLTKLIKDSGYKLQYNSKQVQPNGSGINTCGRHSVMRLMLHHLPLDRYNSLLKRIETETGVRPDDLATAFIADAIGK
jgi:hypothetical protein